MNFRAHRMNFGDRRRLRSSEYFPWLLVILLTAFLIGMLAGCSTFTKNPDGTETQDSPQVSMQKRIRQTQFVLAGVRGAVDASRCSATVTKDCFDAATANTYIGYLDQAKDALAFADSALTGSPCFIKATCTDAEMQASAEAIGRAVAYIARVTSKLKKS